jgi:hypothetical protein
MNKLTKEELDNVQGLVTQFNKLKIELADAVLAQTSITKNIEAVKSKYAEQEKTFIEKYGENAVINVETGEVKKA